MIMRNERRGPEQISEIVSIEDGWINHARIFDVHQPDVSKNTNLVLYLGMTYLCLPKDLNTGEKRTKESFGSGVQPKHVVEIKADDLETKEVSTSATASEEIMMMSLAIFVVMCIGFEAMIVISHRVVYRVVPINR